MAFKEAGRCDFKFKALSAWNILSINGRRCLKANYSDLSTHHTVVLVTLPSCCDHLYAVDILQYVINEMHCGLYF